ncbi:MAG TPA: cytochrome c [Bacteroidota bacterium]|nr:cytochrome c [Bacteroidota bacterium]
MKKFLKWTLIVVGSLLVIGFLGFLYMIPPLTVIPQEEFINGTSAMHQTLDHIKNPVERLMAERGRYIVLTTGCSDCHTPQGEMGPIPEKFLAGGLALAADYAGTVYSRNLTPDPATGLGKRTDAQLMRTLRSGVFHTGRLINYRAMPWAGFSKMSDEDLRAVIAYLRNIKPVRHDIPDIKQTLNIAAPPHVEIFIPGDFAKHE